MSEKSIFSKLLQIQKELKCEKSQVNRFGGYTFRNKEDILEAVKPLAHGLGCVVLVSDEVLLLNNGWVYIQSTATLRDCESGLSVVAISQAREPETKKGMDVSQLTGTAASYAGKRALGNLFAIDDTKDADSLNTHESSQNATRAKQPTRADIELWEAVKAYANMRGLDPKEFAEKIKQRHDYADNDKSKKFIAEELRSLLDESN